ncbi:uncharacterized protein ACR2FA_010545 [Aphomia sociella]
MIINMDLFTELIIKEEHDLTYDENNLEFEYNVKVESEETEIVDELQCVVDDGEPTSCQKSMNTCEELCLICNSVFPSSYSLIKHNMSHLRVDIEHLTIEKYKCKRCTSLYINDDEENKHTCKDVQDQLKQHYEVVTNDVVDTVPDKQTAFSISQRPCNICGKMLTYKSWHGHMQSVHNEQSYTCDLCNKKFSAKKYIQNHILYVHKKKRFDKNVREKCKLCPSVFINRASNHHMSYGLIKHNLSHLRVDIEHLTIEKYKCNRCNALYINEDEENKHTCKDVQEQLKQHYQVGSNDLVDTVPDKQTAFSKSQRPCYICGKILTYKSWHGHMQNVHNELSYTCDLCNKKFSAKKYIQNHILYVHGKKRFGNNVTEKCKLCPSVFTNRASKHHMSYSLIKHNLSHLWVNIERLAIEKYKCNRCNALYINGDEENKHTCKDDLVNTVPNKKFSEKKYIRNHILSVHQKESFVKNVTEKCKLCPSVFPNRASMKHHMWYCHSDFVKCKICKSKMKKANLDTHMKRMHSNDGVTHKCRRCERVFKAAVYLNRHMKVSRCHQKRVDIEHLTIEKYKWNRCNALYINEDEGNKHTCKDVQDLLQNEVDTNDLVDSVPDKQTPFSKSPRPCNICGKMLMYKSWHGHMQNVHNEQSYTCDLCNKKFSAKKYIRNHILFFHQKKRFVKNVTEKCKLCPSIFPNRASMKNHMRYWHSVFAKCNILTFTVTGAWSPTSAQSSVTDITLVGPGTCEYWALAGSHD